MELSQESEDAIEVAWREALLAARLRALADLSVAGSASLVFARHARVSQGGDFLDALESRALAAGFAAARVPVFEERAFDAFDAMVRAVGRAVRVKDTADGTHGVLALLDAFLASRGEGALADFDAGAATYHAAGDLIGLARAYVEASRRPAREAARIEAWLKGTELSRADEGVGALASVSARTAKRALSELTVLVRVLGLRGTLVMFEGAGVLTKLPAGRREAALTVLRELADNADGGRGMVSAQVVIAGGPALFAGPKSIEVLAPLASRVRPPRDAPPGVPPPHRPLIDLGPPPDWRPRSPGVVARPRAHREPPRLELRALIRASQGLPAVDPAVSLSVGHERIDATITQLFEHSAMQGSVFALLSGAYGSGKTHLLLHLSARALADKRPVLRLSLEQLDADFGNPQRHLQRLLAEGTLPVAGHPSPLDRLVAWTRSQKQTRRLLEALEALAHEGGDTGDAAAKLLRRATQPKARAGAVLEAYLSATELANKSAQANYRHDAYTRLLLWFALLERVEGCAGPVLIVDEAENLYRGGTSPAERRTALRSLAFYCGGMLPGACVVLAVTPGALAELRKEAPPLLAELAEQRTLLSWEDAAMLKRRLRLAAAIEVPALVRDHRAVLAFQIQAAHAKVRGAVRDSAWAGYVAALVLEDITPRELVRRVVDRLERLWWEQAGQ